LLLLSLVFLVATSLLLVEQSAAYHEKHKKGHVKVKVWRGPSHGHKKHKYAPFGYHFSVEEKGH